MRPGPGGMGPGGPGGMGPGGMRIQPVGQQQQPEPARNLTVQLTPQERGFYSNMLSLADPLGYNKVGGKDAVNFFKKSGLPVDKLKTVWKMAARTSSDNLSRDEFYVALRLIAYLQNGKEANEQAIILNVPVALPDFNVGAAERA